MSIRDAQAAISMLTRYDDHWLAIGPPLIITDDHADEIIAILDQSIRDVLADL